MTVVSHHRTHHTWLMHGGRRGRGRGAYFYKLIFIPHLILIVIKAVHTCTDTRVHALTLIYIFFAYFDFNIFTTRVTDENYGNLSPILDRIQYLELV